jgi:hypothetical protein
MVKATNRIPIVSELIPARSASAMRAMKMTKPPV